MVYHVFLEFEMERLKFFELLVGKRYMLNFGCPLGIERSVPRTGVGTLPVDRMNVWEPERYSFRYVHKKFETVSRNDQNFKAVCLSNSCDAVSGSFSNSLMNAEVHNDLAIETAFLGRNSLFH